MLPCVRGVFDHAGPTTPRLRGVVGVAFCSDKQHRHPGCQMFRGSIPGPHVPLSTLGTCPRGHTPMTRGHRGWLTLRCTALASATPHRSSRRFLSDFRDSTANERGPPHCQRRRRPRRNRAATARALPRAFGNPARCVTARRTFGSTTRSTARVALTLTRETRRGGPGPRRRGKPRSRGLADARRHGHQTNARDSRLRHNRSRPHLPSQ